jgi:hypothetical protein
MNVDLAAQRAMDRMSHAGVDSLSESEKTIAAVWLFAAGVGNGGFSGYFKSWRSDLAFHAPAALRAIGATGMAGIATEANGVFGPYGPPADRDARRAFVEALPESAQRILTDLDERYFRCEEDVDELLEKFVVANRASA